MTTIKKYKLINPSFFTTNKDGKSYIDKNNKPFRRASFKVDESKGNYVYGNVFDPQIDWKDGDEVEMIITEGEYNGKPSYSFELPKKEDRYASRIEHLENEVTKLNLALVSVEKYLWPDGKVNGTNIPYPNYQKETGLKQGEIHPFDHTLETDLGPVDDNFGL